MRRARNLTATTFKPALDRHVAMDGADVVLWCDGDGVLVLRYQRDEGWRVFRFPALSEAAASGAIRWCGQAFAAEGEAVALFDESSSAQDWERFYRDCFRSAAEAALRRGDAAELASA